MITLTPEGDIVRLIDDDNMDMLVARRLEVFFDPNEDGSPSLNGKMLWHTEWWVFSAGRMLRSKSIGPRIERTIEQVALGAFGGLPGLDVIAAVKAAYATHAQEDFAPVVEPEPEYPA